MMTGTEARAEFWRKLLAQRSGELGRERAANVALQFERGELLAALRQLLAAPDLHLEELDPRTVAAIQRAERAIRNADKSREG